MKKLIIATAALTLTCSGVAIAQNSTGPTPQSDNMNNPGMTGTAKTGAAHNGTTGSAMKPDASQQGAGPAASVNAKGTSTEPGKVQEGKTR